MPRRTESDRFLRPTRGQSKSRRGRTCTQPGDAFRRILKVRQCDACGEIHEPGSFMQYQVAIVAGSFLYGYFCVNCEEGAYQWPDRPMSEPEARFDVIPEDPRYEHL